MGVPPCVVTKTSKSACDLCVVTKMVSAEACAGNNKSTSKSTVLICRELRRSLPVAA